MTLVEKLIAMQKTLGASDRQMAAKLDIKLTTWFNVRTGKRDMGRSTLRQVYKAFPELKEDIFEYAVAEEVVA